MWDDLMQGQDRANTENLSPPLRISVSSSISLPVFVFLPQLHLYLYWSLCIVFLCLFFPPSSSSTAVFLHICRLYARPSSGLSHYLSPSFSISISMCLCLSSDTASTRINYLKAHLILSHIHTLAHTLCNGSLTLSWEPNLVLTR